MRRTGYRLRLRQVLETRPVRNMTERQLRCVLRGFVQSLEVNPGIILQLNLGCPSFQIISISFHIRICIDAISTDMQTASSAKKSFFFRWIHTGFRANAAFYPTDTEGSFIRQRRMMSVKVTHLPPFCTNFEREWLCVHRQYANTSYDKREEGKRLYLYLLHRASQNKPQEN